MKSPTSQTVKRGWMRVVGLCKESILTTCPVVAKNIQTLRAWARRVGDHTDPITRPLPPDYGHEEIGPTGEIRPHLLASTRI